MTATVDLVKHDPPTTKDPAITDHDAVEEILERNQGRCPGCGRTPRGHWWARGVNAETGMRTGRWWTCDELREIEASCARTARVARRQRWRRW